jgi:hypothetical protein
MAKVKDYEDLSDPNRMEKGSYSIQRFFYPSPHFMVYKGDTAIAVTKHERNAWKIFNKLVEEGKSG